MVGGVNVVKSCKSRLLLIKQPAFAGPRWETRTPGLMVPNLCLNLQAELSRTLWRFLSLQQFLFGTFLPCLLQAPLSPFGICVGLNSVY